MIELEFLYHICYGHVMVRYNGEEYNAQMINPNDFKLPLIAKEILIVYTYNGKRNMLIRIA